MHVDLDGKIAVVMGGTKGIGKAITLRLAESGARVFFQGRDRAAADKIQAEGERIGIRPEFVFAQLDDYRQIDGVLCHAIDKRGKVDIVVASGGTRRTAPKIFHDMDPDELFKSLEDRLANRLAIFHSAVRHMKPNGYGKIINITSDAGRTPTPSESLIGTAAAGLIFLTRALGKEFARYGVRINSIASSLTTDTPPYEWFVAERKQNPNSVIVKAFTKIEESAPFGLNRPEDLANLAVFLSAPESDQISGATVSMNGGISFPG